MIWKEKYNVGVPVIDQQHKELFERVTTFVETLRSQKDWSEKVDQVNTTLAFMKEYVVTHFADEEGLSEENRLSGLRGAQKDPSGHGSLRGRGPPRSTNRQALWNSPCSSLRASCWHGLSTMSSRKTRRLRITTGLGGRQNDG